MAEPAIENTVALSPFARAAEVAENSFNEEANTIDVVWAAGAKVRRYSWRDGTYYDEALVMTPKAVRLGRMNAGAPFLDTHDSWSLRSVIGAVAPGSAKIEGGKGVATVKLSRAPEDAATVSKIRDGIIRNISVGYVAHQIEKLEPGKDGGVAEWRVLDWEPMEISAVPIPADPNAQVRSSGEAAVGAPSYPCVFISSATAAHKDSPMTDTANDIRAADPVVVAPAVVAPVTDTRAATDAAEPAVRADRERSSGIMTVARKLKAEEFGTQHAEQGTSLARFHELLVDHLAERAAALPDTNTNVGATVGAEHHEKRAALMCEALLHRVNPARDLSDGAREYRGLTLADMAREALELQGQKTRGWSRDEIAERALLQRSGYHSSSDFPAILGNVINTSLRAGYVAAPQTFRPLVREVSASDFKAINRAQLASNGGFQKVNEHGEFKRGSMVESKETYGIATYGEVIAITRKVIINDDMNAFGRIPQLLGQQAAQLESDLVWAQILSNPTMGDGTALFHANHNNLATAAAFGVASLGVARATMAKQVDLDKKTVLNIRPQYLIVPVALETTAEQELKSVFYADTSAKVATASMRSLEIIAEARLDNGIDNASVGAKINGSATAWYLAASPAQVDTVELAYLEGQRGIYTETRNGFDVDGVEVKARLDVGAKVIDHRGLLKNAGG